MKMIKTQQSSRSTVPDWLKWTLLVTFILGIVLAISAYTFYSSILDQKREGFESSRQIALNETELIDITGVERYNGNEVFHIVSGKEETGEKGYAFISTDKKQLETYLQSEMIVDSAKLKQNWQESCRSCEWLDIKLGLEEKRPIWEMTYIDEQGRYVLAHYDAKSGERYQQFAFKRS